MSAVTADLKKQAGRQIHHFHLVKLLGAGAFGAVYSAESANTSPVALKLFLKEELASEESNVLHTLRGTPGVPEWLWFGRDLEYYALVMSKGFMDLDELRHLNFESGDRFSNENVQKIMYQLVTVLEAIHLKGFVHRDVKSNNIMVTIPEGPQNLVQILLIDYGCACRYEDNDEEKDPRSMAGLRHSSARVQSGSPNCPQDDLLQATYTAMALTNDRRVGFFLPFAERLQYKLNLMSEPELHLQDPIRWLHPFFTKVAQQDTFFPIDYEGVRRSIQDSLPSSDASGPLFLIDDAGTLKLS